MAYQICYKEAWGCVHLVHTSEMDIHEAYAARYEIRDLLRDHGCRKVVIDIRGATLHLGAEEEDLYLQSHRNLLPLGVCIALVVDEDLMLDRVRVEKYAMAPGVIQRLFADEAQAVEWLLSAC